jgi:hypothetical protein
MEPNIRLPADARKENARRLAATTGMTVDQADEKLDVPVVVSTAENDSAALQLAEEVIPLISRTFTNVTTKPVSDAAVELLIGKVQPRTKGKAVYASISPEGLMISASGLESNPRCGSPPAGLLLVISACYLCAAVVKHATDIAYPFADTFVLDFDEFGLAPSEYLAAVDLGETHQAGAGAIGNGLRVCSRSFIDFT